jgi:hypothetical protein
MNVIMGQKEIGYEDAEWIYVTQYSVAADPCGHDNESAGSVSGRGSFLD